MNVIFKNLDYVHWLQTVVELINSSDCLKDSIRIVIQENNKNEVLEPFHYVLLKCFIHSLQEKNIHGRLSIKDEKMLNDATSVVQFDKYIADNNQFYISANDDRIFNLFRVEDDKKESYSRQITSYLNKKYFKNKDLSAVQNAILEAYHNISDHSHANGNAYSFVKYDELKMKLYVAVCDFGNGIAVPIRRLYPAINSDYEAILKAIEVRFTIQSQKHNKGLGLDNIISTLSEQDELRIYSNSGCLISKNKKTETFALNFNFKGTLLLFELSINTFDDVEMNDMFTFD